MAELRNDWLLFVTIVILVAFGVVMVYSASSVVAEVRFQSSMHFAWHQAGWAVLSFLVLMLLRNFDYRLLKQPFWAFGPLAIVTLLLIAAYLMDARTHRWIRLGPGSLQPSEFAKPALILFLAWFMTRQGADVNNRRYFLLPAALIVAFLGGLVGDPDMGTAIVLVLTAFVMLFVAGLKWRYIAAAAGMGLLLLIGFIAMKPYRVSRVRNFSPVISDWIDILDSSGKLRLYENRTASRDVDYQPRQSVIAIGAGGPIGRGIMRGLQKFFYLPEAHTDFILAVVGEEFGLIGTLGVLAGFVIILWRGLRLFWMTQDSFGRFIALGVTSSIVIQALINMTVALKIGPVKGIPLPMISYGGSSLLGTLILLGLLLSVSRHAQFRHSPQA